MRKPEPSPTPDALIDRDHMKLAVTHLRPTLFRQSEQEARQEICARLYPIFQKYDASCVPGERH